MAAQAKESPKPGNLLLPEYLSHQETGGQKEQQDTYHVKFIFHLSYLTKNLTLPMSFL